MAYGEKYSCFCKGKHGVVYVLEIYFEGYRGYPYTYRRSMPADRPLILRKDKGGVICGTSLEFAMIEETDFEFDEFYTNSGKHIKCEVREADNFKIIWSGYVAPQQYQAPYVPAPLPVRFTATDGLGLLKKEPFKLTGRKTQFQIIKYCVDKTGLELGYIIADNIWSPISASDKFVVFCVGLFIYFPLSIECVWRRCRHTHFLKFYLTEAAIGDDKSNS